MRADYKLIAKALGRIGNAHLRKGDRVLAIRYFEKSLSEHRTPDILTKLRETEKQHAEAERSAYINPELSNQERDKGNNLFKASLILSCLSRGNLMFLFRPEILRTPSKHTLKRSNATQAMHVVTITVPQRTQS
jgi:hypothetical protein